METLNVWFHWLFSSPGYFLLGLVGFFVFLGLIGGITHTHSSAEEKHAPPDGEDQLPADPWRKRNEQHYQEWNAHQVREQHRTAGKPSAME